MAKYLIQAAYTAEGAKGVQTKGGTSRRDAVEGTVKSVDGELECFYFGFGEHDAFVIADLPDNEAAAAVALTVAASGGARPSTTVLMTPEEMDAAAKRSVDYAAPGS